MLDLLEGDVLTGGAVDLLPDAKHAVLGHQQKPCEAVRLPFHRLLGLRGPADDGRLALEIEKRWLIRRITDLKAVQFPVADLVGQREVEAPFLGGIVRWLQRLVDHDGLGLDPRRAQHIG